MAKEYIERETVIEAFSSELEGGYVLTNSAQTERILRSIPAANVVEVVRCQECKHAAPNGLDIKCNKHSGSTKNRLGEEIGYIEWHTPHFFCADGKRKDGGQDDV